MPFSPYDKILTNWGWVRQGIRNSYFMYYRNGNDRLILCRSYVGTELKVTEVDINGTKVPISKPSDLKMVINLFIKIDIIKDGVRS